MRLYCHSLNSALLWLALNFVSGWEWKVPNKISPSMKSRNGYTSWTVRLGKRVTKRTSQATNRTHPNIQQIISFSFWKSQALQDSLVSCSSSLQAESAAPCV